MKIEDLDGDLLRAAGPRERQGQSVGREKVCTEAADDGSDGGANRRHDAIGGKVGGRFPGRLQPHGKIVGR